MIRRYVIPSINKYQFNVHLTTSTMIDMNKGRCNKGAVTITNTSPFHPFYLNG